MIYPHSNETQTTWDGGGYRVQLCLPNNPRPMGFCDGTEADLAELREIAETEGASVMRIEKKVLKTGREIWTLYGEATGGASGAVSAALALVVVGGHLSASLVLVAVQQENRHTWKHSF